MLIRVVFCWMARSEVEENTDRMENIISRRTIIQMTLSPLKFSTNFQNPSSFTFLPIGYSPRTASLNFRPLSS